MIAIITVVAAIVSSVGLVVTLGLLTWQSRSIARQTEISNAIAATSTLCGTFDQLHRSLEHLFVNPELWDYFYGGKSLPEEGDTRKRALIVAEMMADVLDCGLKSTALLPSTETYDDWLAYARFLADRSPVMKRVVLQHDPAWWPQLKDLFDHGAAGMGKEKEHFLGSGEVVHGLPGGDHSGHAPLPVTGETARLTQA